MTPNTKISMPQLAGMKILFIGGSGFVGKAIVQHLLSLGCDLTLLNRGSHIINNTKQLIADRNSEAEVMSLAKSQLHRFDGVVDTSSYSRDQTKIMWDAFSQKTDRWIHLSSASVYKDVVTAPPKEKDETGGADIWGDYGRKKSAADAFLGEQTHGPSITIFRPPYIYGPGNNLDRETFVWSRMLQDRPVVIPANDRVRIQFVHIDDLSAAVTAALGDHRRRQCTAYNIGADEQLTFREYVSGLASVVGTAGKTIYVEYSGAEYKARQYFPFRDYPCWANTDFIKDDLPWTPAKNFLNGFNETFSFYDRHKLAHASLDTNIEDRILCSAPITPPKHTKGHKHECIK